VTQLNASVVISDAKTDLCLTAGDANYPDAREYHVMVERGITTSVMSI